MIPVFSPVLGAKETANVLDALQCGEISGTSGRYIEEFERAFAAYCGCRYGVAVSSGTAALCIATAIAKTEKDVLMSASTNIASANAVAIHGGRVIPVDADATWNMDTLRLSGLLTKDTTAIMPVHLYGHPVNMHEVMAFARQHGLFVIEDCAEAHGATIDGQKVGSFGDVGCFSFYANKVITTGEGGMLVTNRSDVAEQARALRNLAFGVPRFFHTQVGLNYRMTNVQAAIGCAQLERIEDVITAKREIARKYTERLAGVTGLTLPFERAGVRSVYWMYAMVIGAEFGRSRNALMRRLEDLGVETRTMFCPMNLQPALLQRGAVQTGACPMAENMWDHGLYLPSGIGLSDSDIDHVCDSIRGAACA